MTYGISSGTREVYEVGSLHHGSYFIQFTGQVGRLGSTITKHYCQSFLRPAGPDNSRLVLHSHHHLMNEKADINENEESEK